MALAGADPERDGFDATVLNRSVGEAATRMPRRFTRAMLRTLNPHTRTLTSFRRNEELEVALDVHSRLDPLDFEAEGENPWGIAYCTLFHSKGDSDKFLKREELEADGWALGADRVFRRGAKRRCPLMRASSPTATTTGRRPTRGTRGNKYGRKPNLPQTDG